LPAAGVLASELLRRSQYASQTIHLLSAQFPRSNIIQKLSVYVSHVETLIWSEEGECEIAKQGVRAIGQVLDRVLSPETTLQPHSSVDPDLSTSDWFTGGDMTLVDGTDLIAWLENVDWGQESCLNFG
jgi:chromatin structure-remodeling complex subunit RSC3/30